MAKNLLSDSKCKYEAYDKNEIDANFYKKTEVDAKIVDDESLSDITSQTYSGRIIDEKLNSCFKLSDIKEVSTTVTTTTETHGLLGAYTIDYPTGYNKDNTYVLSTRLTYNTDYNETKYVTAYNNNASFTDTVNVRNFSDNMKLFGRLPSLDIGTEVTISLIIAKFE